MRHDMQKILQQYIHLIFVTDSDSLSKGIMNSSNTMERHLIIDQQEATEDYYEHKTDDIDWITSTCNLTGGLTKMNYSDLLRKTMRTGAVNVIS